MSWLNDYEQDKRKKENAEKQHLAQQEQEKIRLAEMKRSQQEEQERPYQKKVEELSPLVTSLLQDIGRHEYGRNWFWKFLAFTNYSVKFEPKEHRWELHSPEKTVREDRQNYSCQVAYWQVLSIRLMREENKFIFAVGAKEKKTQDVSRSSLQGVLLKTLKEKTAFRQESQIRLDDDQN